MDEIREGLQPQSSTLISIGTACAVGEQHRISPRPRAAPGNRPQRLQDFFLPAVRDDYWK